MNSLLFKLAAGERFERPYPDSKSRVLPLDDPALRFQRDCFHAPHTQHRRFIDVVSKSPAIRTRMVHQFAVVASALAVESRCKFDLKAFEFNRLCTHNFGSKRGESNSHLSLERAASWPLDDDASYLRIGKMRRKKRKPPICIGGSEKLRAMDRPRYMNVPSPAPCRVNAAGVGKQSVWGLRIIACISDFTVTSFQESVKTQKWMAGRESNPDLQLRTLPCCSITLPAHWSSRWESNPDLFVRTEAPSCVRPREPNCGGDAEN
jgi:hypothetical protein